MKPHTQENLELFNKALAEENTRLFATPAFAYVAGKTTPGELARKMTLGLDCGQADKSGEGIIATCKRLAIPHTYKAIRAYLGEK